MHFFQLNKTKSPQVVEQQKNRSEESLIRLAKLSIPNLYQELASTENGHTSENAKKILEKKGKNLITMGKQRGWVHRLVNSLINHFNIVLFIIAGISLLTDVILSSKADYTTCIIIFSLVMVSSIISFVQGERSSKASEKLLKMISNKVDAIRDGRQIEITMEDVVPGDIVKLSAGDIIPGDVRFLYVKDAFLAQSTLTGESAPVEKFSHLKDEDQALTDLSNLGFMGTNMVSGSAMAVVVATGNDTYFGSMTKTLTGDRSKNSFERGVDSISYLLMQLMMILVPLIFIINGMTKGDWMNSFIFAVTMAVGLTPEMLPVIMTFTLAKGAVLMSHHKTIVKSLSSIHTFGEMDILCTDKTGTLTEDKIVLERYMNLHREDDEAVLRHAYLNSYFQTGLKNLIDVAIISRAIKSGYQDLVQKYKLVDEIPFDFSRRRMSVVLVDRNGKRQLITKGAVEEILSICSFVFYQGKVQILTDDLMKEINGIYEEQNSEGMRVVAVTQKNEIPEEGVFSVADERNMVLMGFVSFLDPPKESSKEAITALKAHGVRVVVLTGDSEGVALKVCAKVGVNAEKCMSGQEVAKMDDEQLRHAVKTCDIFAKLSPIQKQSIVEVMQKAGHTVGYMGDGINDTAALQQADVGISVDTAVDIAKETADIILLKKDLMVLEEGILEGRRTFGNIMKYIKMAVSGNIGNMISVIVASIFLPFLPMLPVHILVQNLLCDFAQMGIPFDRVDKQYSLQPRRWETKSIQRFMIAMGSISSLFDILCFAVMWWIVGAQTQRQAMLFQCGWFVFGTLSQILVVLMIRTQKIPFIQSRASFPLMLSSFSVCIIVLIISFTKISYTLALATLPFFYAPWLALLVFGYCLATQLFKMIYIHKFKEWL